MVLRLKSLNKIQISKVALLETKCTNYESPCALLECFLEFLV